MESLAIKYRPKKWEDVVEQSSTTVILQNQLSTGNIQNAYLFCGGAGTGKTTCARIFANEINHGAGIPIELDAASNNSVDDIRGIIAQSKTASLDSEYKVFILDEVHALSNSAWQAMLKVLEEPPKKSIFIMCTTDPQKIPKTILSRVQRFNFQRISQKGIADRLLHILCEENEEDNGLRGISDEALGYIAKLSSGGMRDALTMLDKCLAYSNELTLSNVMKALDLVDYSDMVNFLSSKYDCDYKGCLEVLNSIYMSGYDLKLFVRSLTEFMIDVCKADIIDGEQFMSCPMTDEVKKFLRETTDEIENRDMLASLIKLCNNIKWDTNPKARIEAWVITGE